MYELFAVLITEYHDIYYTAHNTTNHNSNSGEDITYFKNFGFWIEFRNKMCKMPRQLETLQGQHYSNSKPRLNVQILFELQKYLLLIFKDYTFDQDFSVYINVSLNLIF